MRPERRITRADGGYGPGTTDDDVFAETLSRGRRLLAEARALFHFNSRDRFSARRAHGTVIVTNVQRAAPLPAADELAEARLELLAERARLIPGGPR